MASVSHMGRQKVFGLGLARTGTTSLHEAMQLLGLRSAPESTAFLDGIDADHLAAFDAFFDNPVPFRYEQLDTLVGEDARWIVTERSIDEWLASMEWLFGPGQQRLDRRTRALGRRVHLDVYGIDEFDADRLRMVHIEHYAKLRTWLADRPHVWLDLADLSWSPLCELLDLPEPDRPFPRANERAVSPPPTRRWRR